MNIDYDCLAKLKGFMNIFCGNHDEITPYERASIERCKSVFKDAVFFDCGSAGGLWAHCALQAGAKKVICFDTSYRDKNSIDAITENLSSFNDRFQLVGAQVTDTIEKVEGGQIPKITLDSWIEENKIDPTFIKMDIEGDEIRAIPGLKNTIKRLYPKLSLMIEVHSNSPNLKNDIIAKIHSYVTPEQMNPSGENFIMNHIYHLYYLPGSV